MSGIEPLPERRIGAARRDKPVFGDQLPLFDASAWDREKPHMPWLPDPVLKQPDVLAVGDYVLLRFVDAPDYGLVTAVLTSGQRSGELVYRVRKAYAPVESVYPRDDLLLAEAPKTHRPSMAELVRDERRKPRPPSGREPAIYTDGRVSGN